MQSAKEFLWWTSKYQRNTTPIPLGIGVTTHPDPSNDRKISRFDCSAQAVGFPDPPPVAVHLKFLQTGGRWSVFALTKAGRLSQVADWMQIHDPETIRSPPKTAPRVLCAEFQRLPEPWEWLLIADVHAVTVHPAGAASILVRDRPDALARFAVELDARIAVAEAAAATSADISAEHFAGAPRARPKATATITPIGVIPTPRQQEVLSLAVALGYYEVPHKVNQRTMAKKLGMSVGGLSELLRRAESSIIAEWAYHALDTEWTKAKKDVAAVFDLDPATSESTRD